MSAVDTIESNRAQIHFLEGELAKLDRAIAQNITDMVEAVAEADPRERSKLRKWRPEQQEDIKREAFMRLASQALSPLLGDLPLSLKFSEWMLSDDDPERLAKRAINTARITYRNRSDGYRNRVVTVANSDALEAIAARADRQYVDPRSGVAESEPESDGRARIDGAIEREFNWVTILRKEPRAAADSEFESPASQARRRTLMRRLTDDERGALDMRVTSLGMLEKLDALRACPGAWRKSALWCNPLARPVPRQ